MQKSYLQFVKVLSGAIERFSALTGDDKLGIGDIVNVSTILWLKGCAKAGGYDRCSVASAGVATVAAGLHRRFHDSHCVFKATEIFQATSHGASLICFN